MNRVEWQQLAERWLLDARALLKLKRWSAAYYLTGYAVECGLKACVLTYLATTPEVIFEDKKFSERCWTHSLLDLVKLAGLDSARREAIEQDPVLAANWLIAKDWSEQARYETVSHRDAKNLFRAVSDRSNGVLQWIKGHW